MSYYIIIRGPLGIGKSTISRKLSENLSAEYISIDKILEENKLDKGNNGIPLENFIKANEIILEKVKPLLDKGKSVIFDGNFYYKNQLEHLINNLNYEHKVFNLKAPLDVCIERDSKREHSYGKDAAKAVYSFVYKFDYGINIDAAKETTDEVISEINQYLPYPKEGKIKPL